MPVQFYHYQKFQFLLFSQISNQDYRHKNISPSGAVDVCLRTGWRGAIKTAKQQMIYTPFNTKKINNNKLLCTSLCSDRTNQYK